MPEHAPGPGPESTQTTGGPSEAERSAAAELQQAEARSQGTETPTGSEPKPTPLDMPVRREGGGVAGGPARPESGPRPRIGDTRPGAERPRPLPPRREALKPEPPKETEDQRRQRMADEHRARVAEYWEKNTEKAHEMALAEDPYRTAAAGLKEQGEAGLAHRMILAGKDKAEESGREFTSGLHETVKDVIEMSNDPRADSIALRGADLAYQQTLLKTLTGKRDETVIGSEIKVPPPFFIKKIGLKNPIVEMSYHTNLKNTVLVERRNDKTGELISVSVLKTEGPTTKTKGRAAGEVSEVPSKEMEMLLAEIRLEDAAEAAAVIQDRLASPQLAHNEHDNGKPWDVAAYALLADGVSRADASHVLVDYEKNRGIRTTIADVLRRSNKNPGFGEILLSVLKMGGEQTRKAISKGLVPAAKAGGRLAAKGAKRGYQAARSGGARAKTAYDNRRAERAQRWLEKHSPEETTPSETYEDHDDLGGPDTEA